MASDVEKSVRFVAVMCPEKSTRIASYLHSNSEGNCAKYNRMLKVLVKADNPAIDRNTFRVEDAGLVSYVVETYQGTRVLHIAVTAAEYPERLVNTLCERLRSEFSAQFGLQYAAATDDCLSSAAEEIFRPICTMFDDPKGAADALAAAKTKADDVPAKTKADDVAVVVDYRPDLEPTQKNKKNNAVPRDNAQSFKKAANDLRRVQWRQRLKYLSLLFAIAILVAACIFVPLLISKNANATAPATNPQSQPVGLNDVQLGAKTPAKSNSQSKHAETSPSSTVATSSDAKYLEFNVLPNKLFDTLLKDLGAT